MRIVLVHPNSHSGGAEITRNWPPAWVAYLTGSLRRAGFNDIHFIDAMTHHIGHAALRDRLAAMQPDVVGTTAITPAIFEAEEVLKIAREVAPAAVTILGGIHGTFTIASHRPLTFSIARNPLAVGPPQPSCHWHAAVFERLFQRLVWPEAQVTETACCAAGDAACLFRIAPRP